MVDRTRSKHTSQHRPSFCAFYWVTTFSSAERVSGWPKGRNFGGVAGELRRQSLSLKTIQGCSFRIKSHLLEPLKTPPDFLVWPIAALPSDLSANQEEVFSLTCDVETGFKARESACTLKPSSCAMPRSLNSKSYTLNPKP